MGILLHFNLLPIAFSIQLEAIKCCYNFFLFIHRQFTISTDDYHEKRALLPSYKNEQKILTSVRIDFTIIVILISRKEKEF